MHFYVEQVKSAWCFIEHITPSQYKKKTLSFKYPKYHSSVNQLELNNYQVLVNILP